jgi:predicted enzyme related to lactoylglutathione lyase
MNPVVHFEMGYFDQERMKKFYETAFGWKMKPMGADGGYIVAQTAETDEKDMVKTPGTINGGFYKKIEDPLSHPPSVVIAVKDIKSAMDTVVQNGGKILGAMNEKGEVGMEPQMIPGVGLWISIQDPESNRVSMLQPIAM